MRRSIAEDGAGGLLKVGPLMVGLAVVGGEEGEDEGRSGLWDSDGAIDRGDDDGPAFELILATRMKRVRYESKCQGSAWMSRQMLMVVVERDMGSGRMMANHRGPGRRPQPKRCRLRTQDVGKPSRELHLSFSERKKIPDTSISIQAWLELRPASYPCPPTVPISPTSSWPSSPPSP